MRTVEYGKPGAHVARVGTVALAKSLLWGTGALIGFIGTLLVGSSDTGLRAVSIAAGALGTISCAAMSSKLRTTAARAHAGAGAERVVGKALSRLGFDVVVHGAVISHGDVDHVAFGPVAMVVESKYGRGRLEVRDGKIRAGQKVLPRNPIGQARRQADQVAKIIGRPVDAVVCLSEAVGGPLLVDGVWVCGSGELASVVSRLGSRVSAGEAVTLAERVVAKSSAR